MKDKVPFKSVVTIVEKPVYKDKTILKPKLTNKRIPYLADVLYGINRMCKQNKLI